MNLFNPYPQTVFSSSIRKYLFTKSVNNDFLIIDAPCGNGETTYSLSKNNQVKVFGYDLSEKSIRHANETYKRSNLTFECCTILEVFNKHPSVDFFCLINSFFLLPDRDRILKNIHALLASSGELVLVIPNIKGVNYLNFKKTNPLVNLIELDCDGFIRYVQSFGFKLEHKQAICYANLYGRKELTYFSIVAPLYLRCLNSIMTFLKTGTPSYFLLAFNKHETNT
jgi:SAM-dependent methyltransferase